MKRGLLLPALCLTLLTLVVATTDPAQAQRRGGGGRRGGKQNQPAPTPVPAAAGAGQSAPEAAPPPVVAPSPAKDAAILAMEPDLLAYAIGPARAALARAADPAGPQALVAEGRVLTLEMKYTDAMARFDRAATAAPDDPAALVYKGEAQLYARQESGARQSFAEAKRRAQQQIEARGESADTLYLLGVAQQRLGEHDAAFATLDRARSLDPGDARVLYQMGATRYLQERWQDAVDLTTQALERNQRLAYGYWVRGNAAGQVDRKDLLVNDLRRFVELAPAAPEAERARRILASVKG